MKKEIISFRKKVFTNSTLNLKERVKDNGTVEEVRIKFYPGQENALFVRPFVTHNGNIAEDMFTYAEDTNPQLSGDDDYFVFPVSVNVKYDEFINVWVKNTSFSYDYDLCVDVIVSYNVLDEPIGGVM